MFFVYAYSCTRTQSYMFSTCIFRFIINTHRHLTLLLLAHIYKSMQSSGSLLNPFYLHLTCCNIELFRFIFMLNKISRPCKVFLCVKCNSICFVTWDFYVVSSYLMQNFRFPYFCISSQSTCCPSFIGISMSYLATSFLRFAHIFNSWIQV